MDMLNESEAEFAQRIVLELKDPWVKPIIVRIEENGGPTRENLHCLRIEHGEPKLEERLLQLKDTLFELRFAYSLHQVGVTGRTD